MVYVYVLSFDKSLLDFWVSCSLLKNILKPVKHPYPFNDHIVIYVRYLGPGVSVAQAWQEGNNLEQVPRKLCSEILMVKDYTS